LERIEVQMNAGAPSLRRSIVAFVASTLLTAAASAQTNVGQISGTVRDASGAVLPGATITIVNVDTGLARTEVSDDRGTYIVTNLQVGTYSVAAELQGFRRAVKTGFALTADGRITADFTLALGDLSEVVVVTSVRGEVVNRTSGEIARVIDGDQVRDLALSGRNYIELATLIPGAVQLEDDPMVLTTSLSSSGAVINGARGNSANLTVDGGFNLDSGSNASQVNNVGLEFIDQVKIQTSNFSAEYGRNSGPAINVVTRSGTNRFRGSLFETYRDESLDETEFFAPRDENGRQIKGKLDFHDYGGSLGGPMRRNKVFFFGGLEFKQLSRVDGPFRRTLPTLAELGGDFSRRMAGTDGIVGTPDDSGVTDQLMDTLTGEPFPGGVIPAGRITGDGRAIARAYEAMIRRALQYTNLPGGNNATFQLDFPFDWYQTIFRFDYRIDDRRSVYLRHLHDNYDLVEPRGTFIGADLPTITTRRLRPGDGYLLAYNWIVSSNLINEAKVNASWNSQQLSPVGDAWRRDTYGFAFPQVFNRGPYEDGIPNVTVSGFAELEGPARILHSPTTDITATNTLTWLRGAHAAKIGVLVVRNRKDQNGRTTHTGSVSFNTAGNPNTSGHALADALLGNFRTYSEFADDPLGFFRFTQYAAFVSDTWRLHPNLSLEMGLRYERGSPTYSQQNNLSNFDPALYDPRQAVTVLRNGSVVPGSGNPYTGLIRAGTEIPDDQHGRVTLDPAAAALIPTGAPRGLYESAHLFMPRFSAAYSLNETTVLRGGMGVFYDKPDGNIVFSQLNLAPFVPAISVENGNLSNPLGGRPSAAAVLGTVNAIDPGLKFPRQLNFSVSLQRQLPWAHFAEVAYVGNRGRNLLWFPEINQPSFADQIANQALPSAQRASTNFMRPYKGYSSIRQRRSDAFSDYNGLQLYLNRRRGDITYSVSYTLSKAIGNASGSGDNPEDAFNLAFNTGPPSFDRRHALVTTWTIRLPFLRGRRDLAGYVIGGWEISGKTRYQSGQYLTPTGSTSTGTRRADYLGGQINLSRDERTANQWFNTAAFATAPDTRRGDARVGMIEGPERYMWDVSLRKNFSLTGRVRLGTRVDVFNVFNRLNYSNPNTTVTSGSYGRISDTRPPRQMQLSVRLEF
jgi:hypothetical protein